MNWSTLAALCCLSASIHWTIARSTIMRWFWGARWLPGPVAELLECPACSGFWLGLGLGLAGLRPVAMRHPLADIAAAGMLSILGTPVVEAVLMWGLDRTRLTK